MDPRNRDYGVEWPTLALMVATYAGWVTTTLYFDHMGPWVAVPLLALILTMHSSLQHEATHGHPLPSTRASQAMVWPGVGLFIPFARFRDLHIAHHRDSNLTDPHDDPESNYFDPDHFYALPAWWRVVLVFNNTLLGRFVLGPLVGMNGFYRTEIQRIRQGEPGVARAWIVHGLTLLPILAWLLAVSSTPLWAYVLAAYAALSILKIRTFVEHQAHEMSSARSVIIEDRGPLAFLFLNNNLHSVHHAHPQVAWYDLPMLYRQRRDEYLRRNRGYRFPSYLSVAARFLVRPKDPVPHPFLRREG